MPDTSNDREYGSVIYELEDLSDAIHKRIKELGRICEKKSEDSNDGSCNINYKTFKNHLVSGLSNIIEDLSD